MSDVIPIDRDQKVVELFGKLHMNIWQANAGADLIRDLAIDAGRHPDSQDGMQKVQLACNGLLAATSFLIDDIYDLQNTLEVALPDWDKLYANLPDGAAIGEKFGGGAS